MESFDELKAYAATPKTSKPRIYKYNDKARHAFDEMIERIDAEEKAKINTKLAKEFIQKRELLPCVQYILKNGCAKGQRNNTTVALANSLFQIGKDFDEVLEIITYWNAEKNEDPLDQAEIRTTVMSAYNNAKQNRFYGCTVFKDLDVCVKGCPIHK
jgi:phage FluMu gp28-like protein